MMMTAFLSSTQETNVPARSVSSWSKVKATPRFLFRGGGQYQDREEKMTESTSSRSHERRARGGGEACPLLGRTLLPRPLCRVLIQPSHCWWRVRCVVAALVIVPGCGGCVGWTAERGWRQGEKKEGESESKAEGQQHCLSYPLPCPPLTLRSPAHHTQAHGSARDGWDGGTGVGWMARLASSSPPHASPPSIITQNCLLCLSLTFSWSLTAPSTHPHAPRTGFCVLFQDGEGHPK